MEVKLQGNREEKKKTKQSSLPSIQLAHIWLLGLLTPALIVLGSFCDPMLKSILMALPTRRMAKRLTPATKKKGELMSFFWQAEPPH